MLVVENTKDINTVTVKIVDGNTFTSSICLSTIDITTADAATRLYAAKNHQLYTLLIPIE